MVADDRKPVGPHGSGPMPLYYDQLLLILEREIDKLVELICVYKKQLNKLKQRMHRKTK